MTTSPEAVGAAPSVRFPAGFLWGAGLAAFMHEGSPLADGAGPSIQHTFSNTPGNTWDGPPGDAADHYRLFRQDVGLMRELGLSAHRFSVAWPRVLPEGRGEVNVKGLDFYDALVDELLESGIEPFPQLYVWDLPAALQNVGGWANRDCAEWFADYAALVYERLGDRIGHWLTVCEPWAIMHLGHVVGEVAPGIRDLHTALRVGHHTLLGHGRAVEAFRASGARGEIGLSSLMCHIQAATDADADVVAAERTHRYFNELYLDPVMLGTYPEETVERLGSAWPEIAEGDLDVISTPIDFLGVNYYLRWTVEDLPESERASEPPKERVLTVLADLLDVRLVPHPGPVTSTEWPIAPDGLHDCLLWIRDRYDSPPLYVTEIGSVFTDEVTDEGRIEDPDRLAYLRDHLAAAHRAITKGVDLRGWFVWSLLDEPDMNFGMVHVDFATKRRTVKSSGEWYRDVVAANSLVSPHPNGGRATGTVRRSFLESENTEEDNW